MVRWRFFFYVGYSILSISPTAMLRSSSNIKVNKMEELISYPNTKVKKGGITIFYELKNSADLSKPLISAFPLKSGINGNTKKI